MDNQNQEGGRIAELEALAAAGQLHAAAGVDTLLERQTQTWE